MKVRIETTDGNPLRFHVWDVESGQKIGLIQRAFLRVGLAASVLMLLIDGEAGHYLDGREDPRYGYIFEGD